jgi:hypothetical protein
VGNARRTLGCRGGHIEYRVIASLPTPTFCIRQNAGAGRSPLHFLLSFFWIATMLSAFGFRLFSFLRLDTPSVCLMGSLHIRIHFWKTLFSHTFFLSHLYLCISTYLSGVVIWKYSRPLSLPVKKSFISTLISLHNISRFASWLSCMHKNYSSIHKMNPPIAYPHLSMHLMSVQPDSPIEPARLGCIGQPSQTFSSF